MSWPGERLIIRLWETLSEKGIGSLLKPWQIRREGLAHLEVRRAELLAFAQTERDAEDIRLGNKQLGDFSPELQFAAKALAPLQAKPRLEPRIDLPSVVEAAARQTIEDSVRRQVNVAHAITHAEEVLKNDPDEPSSKGVNDDWMFRWRDYAGEVSKDSMQDLWGRILAGELKAPGSFSLRTLDFLRNLSQEEAAAIQSIAPFAMGDVIFRDDELTSEVSFATLMSMQDLGVLSGVEALGLQTQWRSNDTNGFVKALVCNDKVLIVRHKDPNKTLTLPIYIITQTGRQLLKLTKVSADLPYLKRVAKAASKGGFVVSIADFVRMVDSRIEGRNEKPLDLDLGDQNQQSEA